MINNAREKRVSIGFCEIATCSEQREAKAVIKETGQSPGTRKELMRLEKRDFEWERWGRQWSNVEGEILGWKDTMMNGWDADGGVWENEPNKVCMKATWVCYFVSQLKSAQNIQNKSREWEMERYVSSLSFFFLSSILPFPRPFFPFTVWRVKPMTSYVSDKCYTINLVPQLWKAKTKYD